MERSVISSTCRVCGTLSIVGGILVAVASFVFLQSMLLAVAYLVGGVISGALLCAVSEHLDNQELMISQMEELVRTTKQGRPVSGEAPKQPVASAAAPSAGAPVVRRANPNAPTYSAMRKCPECGTMMSSQARSCYECGHSF